MRTAIAKRLSHASAATAPSTRSRGTPGGGTPVSACHLCNQESRIVPETPSNRFSSRLTRGYLPGECSCKYFSTTVHTRSSTGKPRPQSASREGGKGGVTVCVALRWRFGTAVGSRSSFAVVKHVNTQAEGCSERCVLKFVLKAERGS